MKLCLLSKYPPIEGGESSKAYWLAKALGQRGHEVRVVTNAFEVESDYREHLDPDDLNCYQPANVTVHNTDPFIDPWYIPYSNPFTAKLASLAIEIIRGHNLQLIDSAYILPYGISGFIAKIITGKPQILRHAGSDMSRLLASPYLNTLFKELFKNVDKIVTYPSTLPRFLELGVPESKISLDIRVSVDTTAFNPTVAPTDLPKCVRRSIRNLPVITYIGKVGITKGVFELVEALGGIKKDFILLFVSSGRGMGKLKDMVARNQLDDKTIFLGFVPPWKIPAIIKVSTCVIHPERDFPVSAHNPILPREVLATGTCLVLSSELYKKYAWSKMREGEHALVINPKNIKEFRQKLEKVIADPEFAKKIGQKGYELSRAIEDFEGYIKGVESLYYEVFGST